MKTKGPFSIQEVGKLCKEKDLQALVVVAVAGDGTVQVVTYGETKSKCAAIGRWGQGLWNYAIALDPFQTVFGWGRGGRNMKEDQNG